MSDYGHNATDIAIERLSKDIRREYKKASQEVEAKLKDYMKRFEAKDKKWAEWVAEGKKTKQEYKAWRTQQMLVGKRWKNLRDDLARTYRKADKVAYEYITKGKAEVFTLNANYSTYQIEKELGISTNFTQYNPDAVLRNIAKDPEFLPPPGKKLAKQLRENRALKWHRQKIQSVATQAILQGESITKVAKRISNELGNRTTKEAIRDARTMMTGAENAGNYEAYERARDMGLPFTDYWSAVHDSRTRTSHRNLDGQPRGENGYFSNGLQYPGDPWGEPAETYNCRCKLESFFSGIEKDFEQIYNNHDRRDDIKDMTWDEWKKATPVSQDILSQKRKGEYYKWQYIKEYMTR